MSLTNSRAEQVVNKFEQGDFLGIAGVVCSQEWPAAEIDESIMHWDSRAFEHFTTPVALEGVLFDGDLKQAEIEVGQARFHIFGDDEMDVLVNVYNQDFVRKDPLSRDVVSAFVSAYISHPHLACLKVLRDRRSNGVANRQTEKQSRPKGFRVRLNGVVQADI